MGFEYGSSQQASTRILDEREFVRGWSQAEASTRLGCGFHNGNREWDMRKQHGKKSYSVRDQEIEYVQDFEGREGYKKDHIYTKKSIQEWERHKERAASIVLDYEECAQKLSFVSALSSRLHHLEDQIQKGRRKKASSLHGVRRKKKRSSTIFLTRLHLSTSDLSCSFILVYYSFKFFVTKF